MARKPFHPKPWGVGDTVHYEGREGVVWSPGPIPGSVWVQEADGRMVAVKRSTKVTPARVLVGPRFENHSRRLARAEVIRHGAVERIEKTYPTRDFRGMATTAVSVSEKIHASAECAEISGELLASYPRGRVALRDLLDLPAGNGALPHFCPCIHEEVKRKAA